MSTGKSADYWRAKAEECRTIGDNMKAPEHTAEMYSYADQYELLACMETSGTYYAASPWPAFRHPCDN